MVVSLFILLGRGAVEARIPIRYQKFKRLNTSIPPRALALHSFALSLAIDPFTLHHLISPFQPSTLPSQTGNSYTNFPTEPSPRAKGPPSHLALPILSKAHLSPARPAIQRPPSPRPPATPTPNQRRGRLAASGAPRCQIRAGWRGCEMLSSEQELALRGGGGRPLAVAAARGWPLGLRG